MYTLTSPPPTSRWSVVRREVIVGTGLVLDLFFFSFPRGPLTFGRCHRERRFVPVPFPGACSHLGPEKASAPYKGGFSHTVCFIAVERAGGCENVSRSVQEELGVAEGGLEIRRRDKVSVVGDKDGANVFRTPMAGRGS